jgi:L-alanine-DL-glutamate epimerase-like enolase superfamily enzyme
MKIDSVICQVLRVPSVEKKTASSQDVVLMRVISSDGLEGIGEADASPEVVKAIVDAPFSHNIACGLREILLGENPLETERLWQKMYRRTQYFGRSSVTIAAMSAVDMALWDLKGKVFGQPIHRLLGGKQHERISLRLDSLGRDAGNRLHCAPLDEGGLLRDQIRLGTDGPEGSPDLELVADREGAGDARCSLTPAAVWDARTALRRAEAFAEFNINWLEEPLRADDVDGYVGCATARPCPSLRARPSATRSFRPHRPACARRLPGGSSRCGFATEITSRSASGNRRVCAITATPARSPWRRACTGFPPAATPLSSELRGRFADAAQLTLEKVDAVNGWMTVPDKPGLGVTERGFRKDWWPSPTADIAASGKRLPLVFAGAFSRCSWPSASSAISTGWPCRSQGQSGSFRSSRSVLSKWAGFIPPSWRLIPPA